MMLLLISLDGPLLWAIPGHGIPVRYISITVGGKWDCYRCSWSDLPLILHSVWKDRHLYKQLPADVWRQPRTKEHRIELLAHDLGRRVFARAGLSVAHPFVEQGPYDMVVTGVHGRVRVQSKARTLPHGGHQARCIVLKRRAGPQAFRQYASSDFDALVIYLLRDEALLGFFLFLLSN
uniref:PD(D/E)XK endonuclease domain-containing protein n=1 Tax=Pyrodinium bahamense TaxID=73915 RepID=A0A7S0FWN1_9DINO|mmetsp:Transcript_5848/g.16198  ORF Transcript_5848/g.16198 Transcript_5848/m.16198 type:complete len:178 (+) Transcript_5848:23-556(+)